MDIGRGDSSVFYLSFFFCSGRCPEAAGRHEFHGRELGATGLAVPVDPPFPFPSPQERETQFLGRGLRSLVELS